MTTIYEVFQTMVLIMMVHKSYHCTFSLKLGENPLKIFHNRLKNETQEKKV